MQSAAGRLFISTISPPSVRLYPPSATKSEKPCCAAKCAAEACKRPVASAVKWPFSRRRSMQRTALSGITIVCPMLSVPSMSKKKYFLCIVCSYRLYFL